MKKSILIAIVLLLSALLLVSCDRNDEDVTLSGISITAMPDKTTYFAGESFDKTGLCVAAVYSDGSRRTISTYALDKDVLSSGDTAVTVSYKGFSASISVTVRENAVVSLELRNAPDKTAFYENDPFDPRGIVLIAHYESGAEREIPVSDLQFDKTVLSTADTDVTVSFGGLSLKLAVSVLKTPTDLIGIELVRLPVKTVYCEGEAFDPTGMIVNLCRKDGSKTPCSPAELTFSAARNGAVSAYFAGFSCEIAIKTVSGTAKPFVSDYTDKEYRDAIASHTLLHADSKEYDSPFGNKNADYANLLENPCPDGVVKSRSELIDYVDYHAFYYVGSIVVKPDFGFSDFENELDYVYYNSSVVASTCAIQSEKLPDGWYQIRLRFYTDTFVCFANADRAVPKNLTYAAARSDRTFFTSSRIDPASGVTVYDSEQLCCALAKGHKVAPIPGSPAETVLQKAYDILGSYCSDKMDAHEKVLAIAYYLLTVRYDEEGEMEWASRILSVTEPDMLTSQLVSFRAEGPLLFGNAACFGYAKAFGLLLSLEDIDYVRVVGRSDTTKGRVPFDFDPVTGYDLDGGFSYHSYLYVRIDGKDYIADGTYGYAGSLSVGSHNLIIHRQPGIGLTKQSHSEVYRNIVDDYASSETYRPDPSYDFMRINGLLIDTAEDLYKALDLYALRIKESDADALEINLTVSQSLLIDHDVRSVVNSFCLQNCDSKYGFYSFSGNTHEDRPYLEYLILITK